MKQLRTRRQMNCPKLLSSSTNLNKMCWNSLLGWISSRDDETRGTQTIIRVPSCPSRYRSTERWSGNPQWEHGTDITGSLPTVIFFLSNALKWLTTLLLVYEPTSIRISFGVVSIHRILHLGTISHRAFPITFTSVSSHKTYRSAWAPIIPIEQKISNIVLLKCFSWIAWKLKPVSESRLYLNRLIWRTILGRVYCYT